MTNWQLGKKKYNFQPISSLSQFLTSHFFFTSFILLVLISYIFLRTSSASSGLFIARRNFGLSGKNENATVFNALTNVMMIIYNLHGTKSTKNRFRLQFIGITKRPIIPEYMKIIGINIETNDAALGAVSLVWNSLTYEKTLAWSPEMLLEWKFEFELNEQEK